VDSFQWIKNKTTFPEWFNEALVNKTVEITTYAMVIHTLDGDVVINDGDWVFNIKGKLYSCKESVYPNVRETLGATGEFPEGKLNEDDEGELKMAVGHKGKLVFIDFGKPVKWMGMNPTEALQLAKMITEHAERAFFEE